MDEYWSLLPEDLRVDILSRVPAKTLARFRSTSKECNALLKSGSIANNKAPKEESLIIMLKDLRVYLVRISLHRKKVKVASEFYLKDPLSDSSQVDIRSVFHCDGLLLCATEDKRLVVWNPCTGETKWIKPRTSYKESDCYALGYDKDKKYKVLRVDRQDDVIPIKNEYEIYDFTSESWRLVGVATNWFLPLYSRGLSVKGLSTYWVATMVRKASGDFLLCFDFETERFLSLSLPHPFPYSIAALSVARDEQLCVLGINHKYWMEDAAACPNDLQVWVTTSTGSAMSWSKSLGLRRSKYYFSNWMSFLADEQEKVVVCLNSKNILEVLGEKKQILEEHLGGDSTCLSSCSVLMNYVPALARIQQGALLRGRKRKAPSN